MEGRWLNLLLNRSSFFVLSVILLPGCLLHRHRNSDLAAPVNPGDQPDKILYEKATNEIEHARFDVGRLTLQTLINTYPDSEYLAKAKLAIADSYYKEGGVSGLTQAEAEYKDFITFFPTAPEAPEAQFRVGMAHFRLMGKADRDRTEAKLAEAELKDFLAKYPDSALLSRVKRRLREVQEVLAQGDYKIATYYYMKGAMPAARGRFEEIVTEYPDFSRADSALWYLGRTLELLKKPQAAIPYYASIISDYPLSPRVAEAKGRLIAMHQRIPRPTKATLARARADAANRRHQDVFAKFGGMLSSAPDTSITRRGPVHLGGPKPGEVEVAKAPPSTAPVAGSIVVQPLSDPSPSGAPKAVSKPATNTETTQAVATPQQGGEASKTAQASSNSTTESPDESIPPSKRKKGRFHILKKMVKPF